MSKETNKLNLHVIMQRTYRFLFVLGILGLLTQLAFLVFILIINEQYELGTYVNVWFWSSITALLISGLISVIICSKPYVKKIRDWVYFV